MKLRTCLQRRHVAFNESHAVVALVIVALTIDESFQDSAVFKAESGNPIELSVVVPWQMKWPATSIAVAQGLIACHDDLADLLC
jgi:hypothetical protein